MEAYSVICSQKIIFSLNMVDATWGVTLNTAGFSNHFFLQK